MSLQVFWNIYSSSIALTILAIAAALEQSKFRAQRRTLYFVHNDIQVQCSHNMVVAPGELSAKRAPVVTVIQDYPLPSDLSPEWGILI